jgi:hypothetical protein
MHEQKLVIYDMIPEFQGWQPIKYMISLMGESLKGSIKLRSFDKVPLYKQAWYFAQKRPRYVDEPNAIVIVTSLAAIDSLISELLTVKHNRISIWVMDSMWTTRISRLVTNKIFDHIFITTGNDVDEYVSKTKVPTSWLAMGSDVLGLGGAGEKSIDVLRLGRQPNRWENDEKSKTFFEKNNLVFHGRPATTDDILEGYRELLRDYYSKAKYVLVHSNFADESTYTHPTKEYLTPRSLDGLASGCIIIGEQPVSDYTFKTLMWDEAFVNLDSSDVNINGESIIDCVKYWDEKVVYTNYLKALERFDWRWRFLELAQYFNIESGELLDDLDSIRLMLLE